MTEWPEVELDQDLRDLRPLVDETAVALKPILHGNAQDTFPPAAAEALRANGLWAIALAEPHGSGADLRTLVFVLQRLGLGSASAGVAVLHQHVAALDERLAEAVGAGATCIYGEADEAMTSRLDLGLDPDHILLRSGDTFGVLGRSVAPGRDAVAGRRSGLPGLGSVFATIPEEMLDSRDSAKSVAARILWRLGIAAIAAGCASAAVHAAATYVRTRQQFGGPLAELPPVQVKLAELATHLSASWLPLWAVVGRPNALAAASSPSAALVAHSSLRASRECVMTAIGMHGGYGYLAEYEVADLLTDVLSLQASSGLGPENVGHAGVLATEVLG